MRNLQAGPSGPGFAVRCGQCVDAFFRRTATIRVHPACARDSRLRANGKERHPPSDERVFSLSQ
ncbi:hypothetical protein ACFO1S_06760 [Cohnella boryungensis]|uniref:C2H2-type domain-containing protein n=1 Tax=Cohnella boryungensis TaxID=768479 RepID=A0ABV8S6G7_9BACL